MVRSRRWFSITLTLLLTFTLSGCGDIMWSLAHSSPAMRRLNERMNDRMYVRRFAGDPLKDLEWNNKQGDYRFRGLMDMDQRPFRMWLPGLPNRKEPVNRAEYLCYDRTAPWVTAAIHYNTIYNRALLRTRRGKKLDDNGYEIK